MHIAIIGNIGAGKTTLARLLSEKLSDLIRLSPKVHSELGYKVFTKFEAVDDNPYLDDFYKDMNRWSFAAQIFFMNRKLTDLLEIKAFPENIYIQDRTLFEDRYMFVPTLREEGHLAEREYHNYCDLYNSVSKLIGNPDILIYIESGVDNLMDQIHKRNRDCENGISREYIEKLNEKYINFCKNYTGNMIKISGDTCKFEQNEGDLMEIVWAVVKNIRNLKHYEN